MSLDDFPTRDNNSELAALAEVAFEHAIVEARHFVVQQRNEGQSTKLQKSPRTLDLVIQSQK